MNKIIVFPGKAYDVFFMNEINYLKKYFDNIVVISYQGDDKKFNDLAKEYNYKHYSVAPGKIKLLFDVEMYKWLMDSSTIEEVKKAFSLSINGVKKLFYVLFYGIFYVNAKRIVDEETRESLNEKIYLYSYWLTRGAYTISAYNHQRKSNIMKIFSRAHRYDLYEEKNSVKYLPFRDFINENLDEIYFISDHGFEYHNNKYNHCPEGAKKSVSRLGSYNPSGLVKTIHDKTKICIASCSSMIEVKRLDLIIDVLSHLNLSFEWIHIGDGPLRTEIEKYAETKLGSNQFRFMGRIENADILKTYVECDVDFFINMSDSEGIPVSIMEAMSMGIPVIARDVGGNKEIVNARTGLVIEDMDIKSDVYKKINNTVGYRLWDLQKYESLSKESVKMWNSTYDARSNYDTFFKSLHVY